MRAKESSAWQEKQMNLEEEIKTLRGNLSVLEDLSATRYQRCEELQASAEKYHTLKIGIYNNFLFDLVVSNLISKFYVSTRA